MRIISIFMMIFLFCMQVDAAIVQGDPKGRVTMVEVYDYQCPHCIAMYPTVKALIKNNPDLKLRLMPVAIVNKLSLVEATAAIVATKYDNQFLKFTDIAMSYPLKNMRELDVLFQKLGLNNKAFQETMHKKWVYKQLMEGIQFLKVEDSGTPLFVIYPSNNPKVSVVLKGEQTYQLLQKAINQAKSNV